MKAMRIIPLLTITLFMSCISEPAIIEEPPMDETLSEETTPVIQRMTEVPSWVFDSTPVNGSPRIVVVTGPKADREDEEELAVQLAALELAKMQGLYVSAKELSQKGNRNFGYASDVFIDYNKDLAAQYLDNLELEEQIHTPDGTIARFIVEGKSTDLTLDLGSEYPPAWTVQVPEIPGYLLATGVTERNRNWKESFRAADESAMAQIAYTLFGKVDNQVERQESETSTRSRMDQLGTIYIHGEGTFSNMMVLARWTDANEQLFYSLVAVPNP